MITKLLARCIAHQAFKFLALLLLLGGLGGQLTGCAQAKETTTNPPHYALVDNLSGEQVLAPPQRNQYDPKLYRDPDVPFARDLKGYKEYIAREVAKLEMRTGTSGQSIPVEKDCQPFVLPNRLPEPRFRPSSLSNKDSLLEEALTYAKQVREHYAAWAKQVDDEYSAYQKRCKL